MISARKAVAKAQRLVHEDSMGICLACGAEACQVEPDARDYECDVCGEEAVYGAEEVLLNGGRAEDAE